MVALAVLVVFACVLRDGIVYCMYTRQISFQISGEMQDYRFCKKRTVFARFARLVHITNGRDQSFMMRLCLR